jgi:hypothetical protein
MWSNCRIDFPREATKKVLVPSCPWWIKSMTKGSVMRFVNEPVPVEVHIGADGAPAPIAFAWGGRRYKVADRGRAWVEDGAQCFLVMTVAEEIFELRLLADGRWMLARAPERSHIA